MSIWYDPKWHKHKVKTTTFLYFIEQDYRTDEIIALKTAGLSEDEISLYVPRTYEEKSQLRKQLSTKYTSEDAILMMDVAKLKEQVKVLNERLGISDDNRQVMEPNEETGGEGGVMDEEKVVDVEKVEKVEKVDTKEDTMEKMEELEEIDSMERASTGWKQKHTIKIIGK